MASKRDMYVELQVLFDFTWACNTGSEIDCFMQGHGMCKKKQEQNKQDGVILFY